MILGRRLTPFLVALLVLQGGLAVLPHQHDHGTRDGFELTVHSADGVSHDCLACSIHTPAIEDPEGPPTVAGFTDVSSASVFDPPVLGVAHAGNACPRGPPSLV